MHIKMKGDGVSASDPILEFMCALKTKAEADSNVQMLRINPRASAKSTEKLKRV